MLHLAKAIKQPLEIKTEMFINIQCILIENAKTNVLPAVHKYMRFLSILSQTHH